VNSKLGLLAAILVAQLVIVALFWLGAGIGDETAEPFVAIDGAEIAGIVISDGDADVTITKGDDGWLVGDVVADGTKVTNIIDKVAGLEAAWPVATSVASAERFEVTEDNFQRRIELKDGDDDTLAEFFLGTSPGYQRVHARVSGSDDVYSVALSNYELGVTTDSWMDKGLIATASAPTSVRVVVKGDAAEPGDVSGDESVEESADDSAVDSALDSADAKLLPLDATLAQGEEGWLIDGVAADQDEAQTYANRFTTMRVLGIAEPSDAVEQVATIEATDTEGEFRLEITRKDADSSDYVVTSSRVAGTYRLAAYVAEQLMMTDVDFLSEETGEMEPAEEDAGMGEGSVGEESVGDESVGEEPDGE
jgi:hypothetical protein